MRHPTRREVLSAALAAPLALALPGCSARRRGVWRPGGVPRPQPRPSVLFLALDDLNDWIGPLDGHPGVLTPHLDRLAARGTVFTRAYCQAPACNPSRSSLLTGVEVWTTGTDASERHFRHTLPAAVTLPQHFAAHGYEVVGAGKVFHNATPDPPSWQRYFGRPRRPPVKGRPLSGLRARDKQFDWGAVEFPAAELPDSRLADQVISDLERRAAGPLFLAVGLTATHLPWFLPPEFLGLYDPEAITLPAVRADDLDDVGAIASEWVRFWGRTLPQQIFEPEVWAGAVQAYLAAITFIDSVVGRLVEAWERAVDAERSLIVLWSDHGFHLGEKRHWRKFTLWEESARVPLIVVAPGTGRPGQRCERPVNLLDLYPTLIDLCGLSPGEGLAGTSLVPLLADPRAPRERPAITSLGAGNHAVRSERWRYIRYSDGGEELYDHEGDSWEWTNLAPLPEYGEVRAGLARWIPAGV